MRGRPRQGRLIEMVNPTVNPPSAYRPWQLERAVRIAALLVHLPDRGTFVYCEPPWPRCPS